MLGVRQVLGGRSLTSARLQAAPPRNFLYECRPHSTQVGITNGQRSSSAQAFDQLITLYKITEEPCYPYGGNHPWIIKIIAATVSRQHPSRTIVPMTPNFTDTHYDPSPHSLSSPTHHPSSSVQCWLSEVTNSRLLLSCCSFHLITVS